MTPMAAPQTTVVHLLRHGEVFNPDGVLYGRLPGYRLSDLGERQAQAAAEWFAGRDITHLVASPLQRAQQTAAPVSAVTGLQIATDDGLIEAANAFEGRRVAGGSGLFRDPKMFRYFLNPLRPSWGEPYARIAARMMAAAATARDLAAGHEAVCVSHQLPIVCAARLARGLRLAHDPRKRQCSLASVTTLTYRGDEIVDVGYQEPASGLPAGHGAGA